MVFDSASVKSVRDNSDGYKTRSCLVVGLLFLRWCSLLSHELKPTRNIRLKIYEACCRERADFIRYKGSLMRNDVKSR